MGTEIVGSGWTAEGGRPYVDLGLALDGRGRPSLHSYPHREPRRAGQHPAPSYEADDRGDCSVVAQKSQARKNRVPVVLDVIWVSGGHQG